MTFLVRAPDSINGDGSAAVSGAAILDSDNFEMPQGTYTYIPTYIYINAYTQHT